VFSAKGEGKGKKKGLELNTLLVNSVHD